MSVLVQAFMVVAPVCVIILWAAKIFATWLDELMSIGDKLDNLCDKYMD